MAALPCYTGTYLHTYIYTYILIYFDFDWKDPYGAYITMYVP